jgi:hypothetical protein
VRAADVGWKCRPPHPTRAPLALPATLCLPDGDVATTTRDISAVRVTDGDLGLRFEELARDDRLLLASLALAYHRGS